MTRTSDIAHPSVAHRPDPDARDAIAAAIHHPAMVDGVTTALEQRFGSALTSGLRCEIAHQAIDHYRDARVQSFVAILAERLAIEIATQRLGTA